MAKTITVALLGRSTTRTISQNYTNSSGGPVVAFASATYLQNSGNSNYNSLQISAERRARDLTYLLAYTYAKSLDNIAAHWDPRDASRAYGLSSWDMRHNFVASYTWNLPFAHFLGPHRYSEGWEITGITRFNTGFPINLQSGGDFALTNLGLDYPTEVGPIKKLNPHAPAHNYFATSSFASGLSCGYEVCGVTGTAKQFLFTGPGPNQYRRGRGERHEDHGENATQLPHRVFQRLQPSQLPRQRRGRQC